MFSPFLTTENTEEHGNEFFFEEETYSIRGAIAEYRQPTAPVPHTDCF